MMSTTSSASASTQPAPLQGPNSRSTPIPIESQDDPTVACDADGDFVVAWSSEEQDGYDDGVFGQRYDSAGMKLGSEFQINTYTPEAQENAASTVAGSGDFVIVWTSYDQDERTMTVSSASVSRAAACRSVPSSR